MERISATSSNMSPVIEGGNLLAVNAERLAPIFRRLEKDLQNVFADFVLSKDMDEDTRAVVELFVAWREVGEAAGTFAGRLLELSAASLATSAKTASERSTRTAEAERLRSSLLDSNSQQLGEGGGWLRGFFAKGPDAPSRDPAIEQERQEAHKIATMACLEHLAEQLEDGQRRGKAALAETVAEARMHAKAFGEKVVALRPSWRGTSITTTRVQPRPKSDGSGTKVAGLIKSLATVEGRELHKAAEAAAEAKHSPKVVVEEAPLLAPPVEETAAGEWRIRGVYEHQVLKAGLRQLDQKWPVDSLLEFPAGLFREKLLRELITGTIRLQSVPSTDVSAAQRDIQRLSLRQLLRLRILHIDFTPSGCGADTISSVGGTHEAFLNTLDGLLFRQLGRHATCSNGDDNIVVSNSADDHHRFGRDAVFFSAAAAAVSSPIWWVWWLADDRRIFFDVENFMCSQEFPDSNGVLEITDYSRPDRNYPSGRLRWFDWRLCCFTEESQMSSTQNRGNADEVGRSSPNKEDKATSATSSPEKPSQSGTAVAGMINTEVLRDMRSSLKKTQRPSSNS